MFDYKRNDNNYIPCQNFVTPLIFHSYKHTFVASTASFIISIHPSKVAWYCKQKRNKNANISIDIIFFLEMRVYQFSMQYKIDNK